jgi:hypothetical protein
LLKKLIHTLSLVRSQPLLQLPPQLHPQFGHELLIDMGNAKFSRFQFP